MSNKKSNDSAMKKMNNRSALLGRASTLTVAAAAAATASMFPVADAQADCFDPGPVNAVNLSSPQQCVIIDDPVSNGVVVDTTVAESDTNPAFLVNDVIGGRLVNNGIISNSGGTISGIALDIYGGTITDGITNTGLIDSEDDRAIRLRLGASVGGIVNSGTISGLFGIDGTEGITINGDIVNEEGALIEGDEIGIWLHDSGGPMSLYGDILNDGAIEGGSGAIVIETAFFGSSIVNSSTGTIRTTGESAEYSVAAILIDSTTAYTDITNEGLIEGYDAGIAFIGEDFSGNIINRGTIATPGAQGAIRLGTYTSYGDFGSSSINGSITNNGLIDGGEGWGVVLIAGDVGQSGSIDSLHAGPSVAVSEIGSSFGFDNSRSILGGIYVNADQANVNLFNRQAGVISAFYGDPSTGVSLDAWDLTADIKNDGLIEGSAIGMRLGADPIFAQKNLTANIHNRGVISGGSTGLAIVASDSLLHLTNSGTISATGENYDNFATLS